MSNDAAAAGSTRKLQIIRDVQVRSRDVFGDVMIIKLMSSAKPAALQPCMFPGTNLEAALEVHVDVRRPTLGSLARAAGYASSST